MRKVQTNKWVRPTLKELEAGVFASTGRAPTHITHSLRFDVSHPHSVSKPANHTAPSLVNSESLLSSFLSLLRKHTVSRRQPSRRASPWSSPLESLWRVHLAEGCQVRGACPTNRYFNSSRVGRPPLVALLGNLVVFWVGRWRPTISLVSQVHSACACLPPSFPRVVDLSVSKKPYKVAHPTFPDLRRPTAMHTPLPGTSQDQWM